MKRPALSWNAEVRLALAALALLLAGSPAPAQELRLPVKDGSIRFAVIGDTGTGSTAQYDVAKQMIAFHAKLPFEFVIMVGDDLYGGSSADDYRTKFEQPYAALLSGKVKFYASLGNHDNPDERNYKDWNMSGQRFYTWRASPGGLGKLDNPGVRFFALDTNYMDKPQLDWVESELKKSSSEWKIAFFHHPLYSSGRTHGSSLDLRAQLEPLFMKYGVSVVLTGHDHFYERIKPQHGIYHWVCGAGGSLRKGDIDRGTGLTEVGFDTDYSFMLVEIDGTDLYFQAVSRTGQTVDAGVIHHEPFPASAAPSPLPPSPGSTPVAPAPVSPGPPKGSPAPVVSPSPSVSPSPPASPSPKPSPAVKTSPTRRRPATPRRSPSPRPSPKPSPTPPP
ncbi:MAG: metallophosphoesterase [Acidobacteria bacterium]|nr:MAG: metallophosphoesterase [Acidobacteriota bacterium]PYQ25242.1 MAG: metallophosphoesterase [Acidobacteriota bacterium]